MTDNVRRGARVAAFTFALAATAAFAAPAFAVDASKTAMIAADPAKVWAAIGEFCGIADWHPAVEKCELSKQGDKTLRTLSLKGGGTIVEEQTGRSEPGMTYAYAIIESPLPVANYKSTISVAKAGDGSIVSWIGSFDAKGADDAKAQSVIEGIYEGGLEGLAKKVE